MQKQKMSNYLKFMTMWKAEVVFSKGKGTPGKEYLSCLGNKLQKVDNSFLELVTKNMRVE